MEVHQPQPPSQKTPKGGVQSVGANALSTPTGTKQIPPSQSAYTSAEVRRFQTRLEEGYDLPD